MENEENQNLEQSPVAENPKPAIEPKKKSFLSLKWLKFGLVFVVLLLIGGSAYLLGKNNATLKTTPVAQTPAAQQTPTPLSTSPFQPAKLSYRVSSTATGNLFEEKNFGFSFQYSGLKICCSISGPSVGGGINGVTLATNETPIVGSDASFDGFSVYVVPNSENLSFQNYLNQEQKALKKFAPPNLYAQRERVDIGILSGIAFRSLDGSGIENYYFPFPDNKNFLVFGQLDKESGSFEERFKEVLSTFKFTNSAVATPTPNPTANWKTLKGTGFEIKYPSDLYETTSGNGIFSLEPTSSFNESKPLAITYYISIAAFSKKSDMTMNDPYSLFGNGVVLQYTKDLITGKPITNTILGEQSALRIDNIPAGQAGDGSEIYTIVGNTVFEVVISPRQVTGDSEKNKPLIDQILSTFKFTK